MAFKCIFYLNHGAVNDDDEVIFESYSAEFDKIRPGYFGSFNKNEIRIATVFVNGKKAYVSSTCPCCLLSAGRLVKGDHIVATTEIAEFAAEGEDIPNGRPFAIIKYE